MSFDAIRWAMEQHVSHSPAKFVLVALANAVNDADTMLAFPSIAAIAEATAQDRKTVIANISRLIVAGFVEDSGERIGRTKQVIVYRLKNPEIGTVQESQIGNSSALGTVPVLTGNSTGFPLKQSQIRDTEPVNNQSPNQIVSSKARRHGKISSKRSLRSDNLGNDSANLGAERFADFWAAYPLKVGKKNALAAWVKQKLDPRADELIAEVSERALRDPKWRGLTYIPHAATYLRAERWEDEWRASCATARPSPTDIVSGIKYEGFNEHLLDAAA